MIVRINLITTLFLLTTSPFAQASSCPEVDRAKSVLSSCLSTNQKTENELRIVKSEAQSISDTLISGDLHSELRSCESDTYSAEHQVSQLRYEKQNLENWRHRRQSDIREKTRHLNRQTKAWECVLAERKYGTVGMGRGRSKRAAFERAFEDPKVNKGMLKKHGWWGGEYGFCFRIYSKGNDSHEIIEPGRRRRG